MRARAHTNTHNKQKMDNKTSKHHQIGRSKADVVRCKKHPKHRQSPGVCSVCLRERLSQLSSSSSRSNATTMDSSCSSSSLSSLSSHCSSSESSPVHRLYRLASEAKGSSMTMTMSFLRRSSKNNALTKSKSMVSVAQALEGVVDRDRKKKGGFWSKLLRPRRSKKIDEGLLHLHSRTMRERVITSTAKVH